MKYRANSRPPRPKATRHYLQGARASQTEANAKSIVQSAVQLIYSVQRISEITLEDIAQKSGLTVRTILRRFGSRDGVLDAAFAELSKKIEQDLLPTTPGDIEAALRSLLQLYEKNGDLNVKALQQEHELPLLQKLMEHGREEHRAWVASAFAPCLAHLDERARDQRITELYAATDVYLWKLFRRDLRIGKNRTAEAFRDLVFGIVNLDQRNSKQGE